MTETEDRERYERFRDRMRATNAEIQARILAVRQAKDRCHRRGHELTAAELEAVLPAADSGANRDRNRAVPAREHRPKKHYRT